jgi:homoaconitase/3-isopropylmalate dehydratase large subunit
MRAEPIKLPLQRFTIDLDRRLRKVLKHELPDESDLCKHPDVSQLESAHAALQAELFDALAELARVQACIVDQRGVTEGGTCIKCGGLGTRTYGSTATWRGGIGGQQMTTDVCDRCWGSGDENRRWPSHKEFYEMKKAKPALEGGKPQ